MVKTFQFSVKTVDGTIYETPQVMTFPCDDVIPRGTVIIRGYDSGVFNIISTQVYLVEYGGHSFGTTDFLSLTDFISYRDGKCFCCHDGAICGLALGGCVLTLNGCALSLNNKN